MSSCVGSLRRRQTASPEPAEPAGRRFRSLIDIMRATEPSGGGEEDRYADVTCEGCGSGDREEQLVLCDRCDRGYHLFCLRPIAARVPSGPWFCSDCSNRGKKKALISFPVTQSKKIVDFFKIQKCDLAGPGRGPGPDDKCGNHSSSSSSLSLRQDCKKRRRRSTALALRKKRRRRILPYVPSADPQQRLEQMGSLATALTSLKIRFSNDLVYMPGMASRYANHADLEKGGMQILAKEDKETFELCRIMYKRGECPPLVVVFDSIEGFTVNADGYIKDMTFITEYAGDVDYLKNREHDDCDSLMTLLLATNASKSLVICPDKRGNIARFISGINNHTQEGRKKQNLKCVRYNVDGQCRVLLVASRDISPGERLYYDYNGYEQEYPTEHFV